MGSNKTAFESVANSGRSYYSSNTTNTDGKTAIQAFRSFPNNFLLSGYIRGSGIYDRNTNGYYRSSTASSSSDSYRMTMYLNDAFVYPGTIYSYKYMGSSARCLVSNQ